MIRVLLILSAVWLVHAVPPTRQTNVLDSVAIDSSGALKSVTAAAFFGTNNPGAVNVRWFGATGNGVSDDWSAIQTAVETVRPRGGIVDIPAGTFKLTNSITIYDYITLRGVSASDIGSALLFTNLPPGYSGITSTSVFPNGITGVHIEKLRLLNSSGTNSSGISLVYPKDSTFTDNIAVWNMGDRNSHLLKFGDPVYGGAYGGVGLYVANNRGGSGGNVFDFGNNLTSSVISHNYANFSTYSNGFHAYFPNYCMFVANAADSNAGYAYDIEHGEGSSFISCGAELNGKAAMWIHNNSHAINVLSLRGVLNNKLPLIKTIALASPLTTFTSETVPFASGDQVAISQVYEYTGSNYVLSTNYNGTFTALNVGLTNVATTNHGVVSTNVLSCFQIAYTTNGFNPAELSFLSYASTPAQLLAVSNSPSLVKVGDLSETDPTNMCSGIAITQPAEYPWARNASSKSSIDFVTNLTSCTVQSSGNGSSLAGGVTGFSISGTAATCFDMGVELYGFPTNRIGLTRSRQIYAEYNYPDVSIPLIIQNTNSLGYIGAMINRSGGDRSGFIKWSSASTNALSHTAADNWFMGELYDGGNQNFRLSISTNFSRSGEIMSWSTSGALLTGDLSVSHDSTSTVFPVSVSNPNSSGFVGININRANNVRGAFVRLQTAGVDDWYQGTLYNGGSANSDWSLSTSVLKSAAALSVTASGSATFAGSVISTNLTLGAGAPTITSGSGSPSSAEPNGSLYLRTNGQLWHRTNSTWTTY